MKRLTIALLLLATTAVAEPNIETGKAVFQSFCAGCHGVDANGNGPMSEVLTVSPPDLTMLSATNNGVFPTFRVVRQIDGRDPLLAHGGDMPLFGRLFEFPDGAIATESGQPIIAAQPIADVAAWLRSVQK